MTDDNAMRSDDPLLTIEELAQYLGVAVPTIYYWRAQRKGPVAFKFGGMVRYRKSAVDAWLAAQTDHAA